MPEIIAPGATGAAPSSEREFSITIDHWNGEQKDRFGAIAQEILLPAVGRDIVFHVPHGESVDPRDDKAFHIFIWSSPTGVKCEKVPNEMFDFRVDCRDHGFRPSETGVAIVDEATGWAVGELVDNNLYIHHDICHQGTKNELAIFRQLCEAVVGGKRKSAADPEGERRLSRDRYVKACLSALDKTVDKAKREIVENRRRVRERQTEIVNLIREIAYNSAKLKGLEEHKKTGALEEKYAKEFDKLLSLPKVLDVRVSVETINVFTDTLYCAHPRTKKVYEIGKFKIKIYIDGSNGGVNWLNLTCLVHERHAPHVFNNGEACLGSISEALPELIANYEFAVVAMLAIQFVESVNIDDGLGKEIIDWPLAPEHLQPPVEKKSPAARRKKK